MSTCPLGNRLEDLGSYHSSHAGLNQWQKEGCGCLTTPAPSPRRRDNTEMCALHWLAVSAGSWVPREFNLQAPTVVTDSITQPLSSNSLCPPSFLVFCEVSDIFVNSQLNYWHVSFFLRVCFWEIPKWDSPVSFRFRGPHCCQCSLKKVTISISLSCPHPTT